MTTLANPTWNAPRESTDRSVVVTPCDPIEMRLMGVRIAWEPSSFVEESDRKNIYFQLNDGNIREFLMHQENMVEEEGGLMNSCLAKNGLIRCKINVKQVCLYDKDRRSIEPPLKYANWTCNVIVKLIGKWQTPDGNACGLNLQATDIQMLAPYQRECPF